MRSKMVFVAVLVLFVATATGERPEDVKSSRSDKGSHYEVLGKAGVPSLINYQGYLTDDAGNAITDTVEMTFSIWDAASGGNQLWDETQASVSVVNGLFNVLLGSVTPIPTNIFTGTSLWLQTQVGTETLSPRKAIVSVGHAFKASVADTADYAEAATHADTADYAVYVDSVGGFAPHDHGGDTWTGDGTGTGLTLENYSISLRATGSDTGIIVYSPNGPAIVALVGDTTESVKQAKLAKAVVREAVHVVNRDGNGVYGESESGRGVVGMSTSNDGVRGHSSIGNGISGESALGSGIYGKSTNGPGGYFHSENGTGGYFYSKNDYGLRVTSDGLGAAFFEGKVVVNGQLYMNNGKTSIDTTGEIYARSFHTLDSGGSTTSGVTTTGDASFKSVSSTEGVTVPRTGGGTLQVTPDGLLINSEIMNIGQWMSTTGNFSTTGNAEVGGSVSSTNGFEVPRTGGGMNQFTPAGLYMGYDHTTMGQWDSNGNLLTYGDLSVGGNKSAVVPTKSYGQRRLSADESAEVYFFDRGQGQLVNGEVIIQLDPMFLETVTIDDNHPMLVQITLTADCNGVFISEKTATSFRVKELMGGTSDATFDWEVAAKRRGYEDERLEEFTQARR
jgi:hypothetical protein